MIKKTLTIDKLLEHLQDRQTITNDEIEKIHAAFQKDATQTNDPLYIRIIAGIGAWFAAFFVILFLGLAQLIKTGTGATIIGIHILIGAETMLFGILILQKKRPGFLVLYYYALNVDLASKSWILAGSGLILLAIRWIAGRFCQPEEEAV
jgi:hypothetical protein